MTGGVLALACNGEIRYRLRGITVRQRAEWGQREPEGGGDAHGATVRGTEAAIVARRGPETGFRAELHVAPRDAGARFDARLDEALAAWRRELPGLSRRPSSLGHEIVIPDALHTPHEAHFSMVLDRFLDHVESAAWPAALAARIRSRYTPSSRKRTDAVARPWSGPQETTPRGTRAVSTWPPPGPQNLPARGGTRRAAPPRSEDHEQERRRCRTRDTATSTGTS